MKHTKEKILEKHIAIFFNVNKLAGFEDIPLAIFHNAMDEYAKQESAELLEALKDCLIDVTKRCTDLNLDCTEYSTWQKAAKAIKKAIL